MQKKLTVALILALILTAFATTAVLASCGKAGCTAKAADQKGGCQHGKDDKACCAHQKDMMASMEALQKDLATMEKGIPAADQAAFMKAHQANLKKFVDSHAACQKECQMKKGDAKEAPKATEPSKEAPKT